MASPSVNDRTPPPARTRARRPAVRRTLVIGAVLGLLGGALAWSWASGGARSGDAAPPPVDEVHAELLAVAERLFTTPGGQADLTRSAHIRKELSGPPTDVDGEVALRLELTVALLRENKTAEAIQEIDRTFEILRPYPDALGTNQLPHLIRGMAYLRLSEVRNCIERHNDESCVFPLAGGGVHVEKPPAEQAAASYLEVLRIDPEEMTARWLLNLAHMAMGTYPESVPPQHRIPAKGPAAAAFPRFREIATQCGFTRVNHAGGSIAEDFDGDGLLDVALSSCFPSVPLALFRNKGDGTFEDVGARAGLGGQLGGLNHVATDYDNDGHVDIFVTRGGWLYDGGRIRNSLLRNEGDGTFRDVTRAAGLVDPKCPTQVAVWLDYDNDGDLDVFIGNESRKNRPEPNDAPGAGDYPCNLFRNDGTGRFTDVAAAAGVTNDRLCKGAAAGDYDDDGWVDLYVSNIGKNRLYRNKGDGTFVDVAEELGLTEPAKRSFAPWFFDVDNDGDLDLYVGGYDAQVADLAAWYLKRPFKASPPRLYRNKGDGTFEDVTRTYELWRPIAPMGANFGDLDNDGWLDMLLATGTPNYESLMPNVMLRNAGGRHFEDVTVAGGFGNVQKGHGVAFADLDNDGDQDVFNEVGGFYAGDVYYNSLFENPGFGNRFVTLKLVGTRSNRLAYGARIKVTVATPGGKRALHRAVGSVSSFGGSPSRQEIGLGDATAIESIEVWWPASNTRQTFRDVALDSFYEIVEGRDALVPVTPRRLSLGKR
jgi:hypothetical protein